jgi:hypothetical protein
MVWKVNCPSDRAHHIRPSPTYKREPDGENLEIAIRSNSTLTPSTFPSFATVTTKLRQLGGSQTLNSSTDVFLLIDRATPD